MSLENTELAVHSVSESPSLLDRFARNTLHRILTNLSQGNLTLVEGSDRFEFGDTVGPRAELFIHHPSFYRSVLFGGTIGAAESYMAGHWDTSDLTAVVRIICRNMDAMGEMDSGLTRLVKPLRKLAHFFRRNTRAGSRKNIEAHYDLSNDFFASWLDRSMMYSAATFPNPHASLETASRYKLDTICRKLRLGPDDHVLEIGTGWGGFAIHAAKHYGCRVTTTTISKEQYDWAKRRVEEEGLEYHITLLQQDYRDLTGTYDKLVSIEMIEAVGADFVDTYFQACSSLLKPDGVMLIQAITMPEDRYEDALREVDFIKKYIFPGSFIPSIGAMVKASGLGGLNLIHLEDQAAHYSKTLKLWLENFQAKAHLPEIADFGDKFKRMWHWYLAYCEGGFAERVIGSAQLVFAKPRHFGELLMSVPDASFAGAAQE